MLKRYQVLLPDWLEDYIKYIADKHDMSFSEVIRGEICIAIQNTVPGLFPEYKPAITTKEITALIRKDAEEGMERDEEYKILSKIYFETRKAIEYRINKEKKLKKEIKL